MSYGHRDYRSIKDMRVFISYAEDDRIKAEKIQKYLGSIGMHVLWDRRFALGSVFLDEIKRQIAYSHIFLPIVTSSAIKSRWVDQEVGYAVAMNVPILPVAYGELPAGMIGENHALDLRDDGELYRLGRRLTPNELLNLVERDEKRHIALYVCADHPEDRARTFTEYADEVRHLMDGNETARVLQSSVLSSFHIPSRNIDANEWTYRYGPDQQRTANHKARQREERLALQWHALRSGARLIIFPDVLADPKKGPGPLATVTRFQTLVDFLESATDQVELRHGAYNPHGENITIVGDWFMATSALASRSKGYSQTIFTRHAPTIRRNIDMYEQRFDDTRRFPGIASSRMNAIKYLNNQIERLRPGADT
jgi:hypothetical protein